MKLSAYAKKLGIKYQTAHTWFKDGKIEGAYQTATGTIIVPDLEVQNRRTKTVIYARVSSNEQRKTNLETQSQRMVDFCLANGWIVDRVVKEVGSGLNDERKQLVALLKDPTVARIVVEHRDRLTRFGFQYLQVFAEVEGFEIIVANKTLDNDQKDLMADFTAIITSFCARLYSQRRGKKKADAVKLILSETEE
jgi:predicted site-specific integrase-resolvase